MRIFMRIMLLLPLLFVFCLNAVIGQIRNKNTTYLELSGGIPILLDDNQFQQNWKEGERIYGMGLCFTNAKSNYHRIQLNYKEEKVLDNVSFYTNAQLKYLYESMLLKGKYHRSFLGFLYGAGIGFESLKNSPNANLTPDKAYPLLTLGLNFEKFISPTMALFVRLDADATTATISQSIKANAQIGLKFKLSNGQ
jgi:hypothetical protein